MKLFTQNLTKASVLVAFMALAANAYADVEYRNGRRVVTTHDSYDYGRGTAPSVRPGYGPTRPIPTPGHGSQASLGALVDRLVQSTSQLSSLSRGRYGHPRHGSSLASAASQLYNEAVQLQSTYHYYRYSTYQLRDQLSQVQRAHQTVESILMGDRNISARQASAKVGAQLQLIQSKLGYGYGHGHGHGTGYYDFAASSRLAQQIETVAKSLEMDLNREFRYGHLSFDEQLALTSVSRVADAAQQLDSQLKLNSRSSFALSYLDNLSDELFELEFTLPYINVSYHVRETARTLRAKVERLEDLLEHRVPVRTGRRHRGY